MRRKALERCARRLRPSQQLARQIGRQYLLCVLARACGESGEASEGLNLLERALDIARSGAKYQFPELLRAKGDLLLRLNPHDDAAENWLRQALMAARDEGTKSLELRAALSLARLYRAHQREREARDVLSPIYAWFTEGLRDSRSRRGKGLARSTTLEKLHKPFGEEAKPGISTSNSRRVASGSQECLPTRDRWFRGVPRSISQPCDRYSSQGEPARSARAGNQPEISRPSGAIHLHLPTAGDLEFPHEIRSSNGGHHARAPSQGCAHQGLS